MEFVKRENKTKNEEYRKKSELAVGKLAVVITVRLRAGACG